MGNDINDIIERLVESGFKSITIEDEDIIINCLKHSLEVRKDFWAMNEEEMKDYLTIK